MSLVQCSQGKTVSANIAIATKSNNKEDSWKKLAVNLNSEVATGDEPEPEPMLTGQNVTPRLYLMPSPLAVKAETVTHGLLGWYGGKARLARTIARLIPPHKIYLEPFSGMFRVYLAKAATASRIEILNDLDEGLVNLLRVVRNPAQAQQLKRLLELTPYARQEFQDCAHHWREQTDPVEKARMFYVAIAQSFSSHSNGHPSWSFGGQKYGRDGYNVARTYYKGIERIEAVGRRLRTTQLECQPALNVMRRWDSPETVIYCDPPYLPLTRGRVGQYAHEMSYEDHEELLAWCVRPQTQSMVLLSGYQSDLYRQVLEEEGAGWQRQDFDHYAASTTINGRGRGQKGRRIESVWLNPAAQAGLRLRAAQAQAQVQTQTQTEVQAAQLSLFEFE